MMAVMGECPQIRIETIQPVIYGADPQHTGTVLANGADTVTCRSIWIAGVMPITDKIIGLFAIFVQAALEGADPQNASAVQSKGQNEIVAYAIWVFRVMDVSGKMF